MVRNKTYLSEEQQCKNTIDLVHEWYLGITPFIELQPDELDSNWRYVQNNIIKKIRKRKEHKYGNSYKRFLEFFWGEEDWEIGTTWKFGIAENNTKHLLLGDIVVVLMSNGTDRLPVWCASTKGKLVTGYFMETSRCGIKGDIHFIEPPGELVGKQLTHPDALAFMLKLRADKGPQPGRRV